MKLKGKKLDTPKVVYCVIPRDDGDLPFTFRAIVDETEFEKLCPVPSPPKKLLKGGAHVENVEDPGYKSALNHYASSRTNWMFLKSVSATPGLEWDNVDLSNPSTWDNWRNDLKDSGFSNSEQMLLFNAFMDANNLNAAKVEEAKLRFLASLVQPE